LRNLGEMRVDLTSLPLSKGERRIRVVTLALPTTTSLSELYSTADPVALATLLANKAVERSMQYKLEDARDALTNKLVDILGTYKATMTAAGSGASPQLVIAENLKSLPLLLLGLLKHVRGAGKRYHHALAEIVSLLEFPHTGRNTPERPDPSRPACLCPGPPHHPSFPVTGSLSTPDILFLAQHATRSMLFSLLVLL
jgi:hypothetical protein